MGHEEGDLEIPGFGIHFAKDKGFASLARAHDGDKKRLPHRQNLERKLYPERSWRADNTQSYKVEIYTASSKKDISLLKKIQSRIEDAPRGKNEFDTYSGNEVVKKELLEKISKKIAILQEEKLAEYTEGFIAAAMDEDQLETWMNYAKEDYENGFITEAGLQLIKEEAAARSKEIVSSREKLSEAQSENFAKILKELDNINVIAKIAEMRKRVALMRASRELSPDQAETIIKNLESIKERLKNI